MKAFGFKAGIGSASRIAAGPAHYVVGVLVNANTGSRDELRIDGFPVGLALRHELLPVFPRTSAVRTTGRAVDGSIIIVVATNAPLDARQLQAIAKRAAFGLARTGATSHVSSGDLIAAFSTGLIFPKDLPPLQPQTVVGDEDQIDALYAATVEATEAAIDDALFSARTMTGESGVTFYGLPQERVRALLRARSAP